jgi:Flp pilus assembly protein TadD
MAAFTLLVIVGGARATVVRTLPSLYDASDLYSRATEHEDRGDYAAATRELRAATSLQPQELTGYERLALVQAAAGDAAGELATYERAYTFNPLSPRANMILGLAYLRRERFEAASARLRLAVSLAPEDAMPHAALGDLLVAEKKYDEAVTVFERALALDPDESALHNKAAIAFAYAGQLDRAKTHFERAVQLDPNNQEAAGNLQVLIANTREAGK